jgi:hypothetical protein
MIKKTKHHAIVIPLNTSFSKWVENNIAGEILSAQIFNVQLELIDELEERFHKEGFYGAD